MNRTIAQLLPGALAIFLVGGFSGCFASEDSSQEHSLAQEHGADATTDTPHVAVSPSAPAAFGERRVKYWVAPMDPTFISDKPGKSPMGMELVPVYEGGGGRENSAAVVIAPEVVQNMGVRIARVNRRTLFRHVRTIGEVEVAEDALSVVNLRFSGWAEHIYADKTGDPVESGEKLFDIYSPALVAAQEEFLLALRTQGAKSDLARSARRKLELWDVADADVDAIVRKRRAQRALPIRAPRSGYILHKSIVEGARVQEGTDLYRIGDLSRIWVTAEIYEHDAPWVEVGQPAQMELTYEPGKVIEGRVAYIYPTLDKSSRTLPVRLEFENPDNRLKPGMFATVYIQFQRRNNVLVVPTEAILHSGVRQLVFITQDDGHFEPREITTGLVGDRDGTEVLSGLEEGNLVVISGQFLIDSESQLNEAIAKMLRHRKGGTAPPANSAESNDSTVWSCPMHSEVVAEEFGQCPICGMDFEKRAGTPEELQKPHDRHEGHGHATTGHSPRSDSAETTYACPMHPEIMQSDPGRCSICGMFLEEQAQGGQDQ